MYQFGYPVARAVQRRELQFCTGDTYNDGGHEGINCNMTEAASGGPWLDDFDGTFGPSTRSTAGLPGQRRRPYK